MSQHYLPGVQNEASKAYTITYLSGATLRAIYAVNDLIETIPAVKLYSSTLNNGLSDTKINKQSDKQIKSKL